MGQQTLQCLHLHKQGNRPAAQPVKSIVRRESNDASVVLVLVTSQAMQVAGSLMSRGSGPIAGTTKYVGVEVSMRAWCARVCVRMNETSVKLQSTIRACSFSRFISTASRSWFTLALLTMFLARLACDCDGGMNTRRETTHTHARARARARTPIHTNTRCVLCDLHWRAWCGGYDSGFACTSVCADRTLTGWQMHRYVRSAASRSFPRSSSQLTTRMRSSVLRCFRLHVARADTIHGAYAVKHVLQRTIRALHPTTLWSELNADKTNHAR